MTKFWTLVGTFALAGLLAMPAALAGADWEWTKDKGWTQGLGQAKPTPDEQLKYAWSLEKDGQFMNATKQYFLLLKTFPDSEESGIGLQRLANCLFRMENYYDSYKALEQVIKSYPLSAKKSYLIKLEFLIGRKFQEGARKNLLDERELPTVGANSAIEIFQSVIDNDPVGPYAGSATLAIAESYKKLENPQQGIVYCDRVINEFSLSTELVGKARILKAQFEVILGKADVGVVNRTIAEVKASMAEDVKRKANNPANPATPANPAGASADAGDQDISPVTNYQDDIRQLEEQQAKKMWDSAQFYRSRGSRDSIAAYKFTLEQITVRFPNTSYASKARSIVGGIKVPPKDNSLLKVNLPWGGEKEPSFVVEGNTKNHVPTADVPVPGAGSDDELDLADGSAAGPEPVAPPKLINTNSAPRATPAQKTTSATGKKAATTDRPALAQASPDGPAALGSQTEPVTMPSGDGVPPGQSAAGIHPGGLKSATPSAAQPRNPATAGRASAATPLADSSAVVSRPVPTSGFSDVPPDSGSSAIPAAIRRQPAVSTPASPARSGSAGAATPASAATAAPTASATPAKKIATVVPVTTSAPAAAANPAATAPAVDPQVKSAFDAAERKARSTANDAAAQTGNWEFSPEFK